MLVEVYKNLHNGMMSIRAGEGEFKGRVIGYATDLVMRDVKFHVQAAGRQKVLDQKKKNVHAFMKGELVSSLDYESRLGDFIPPAESNLVWGGGINRVTYNPYAHDKFFRTATTGAIIDVNDAELVVVCDCKPYMLR